MLQSDPNRTYDLIALAGSAGSLRPLLGIVRSLPSNFPVPVIIAQHHGHHLPCVYLDLFSQRSSVRICQPRDQDPLQHGTVYIPPPGYHILVNPNLSVELRKRAKKDLYCPGISLLFHSIFDSGLKAVAVVLSGYGSDGSNALQGLKLTGGTVIAQDVNVEGEPDMPDSAIKTGYVDYCLPAAVIPNALRMLVMVPRRNADLQNFKPRVIDQ